METRPARGEREVIAPTVKGHRRRPIGKGDFAIDVPHDRVVCPEGHATTHWTWVGQRTGRGKPTQRTKRFAFSQELCRACPRYTDGVQDQRRRGRFVQLHPDEARLQAARAFEQTDYFREQYQKRVVVEHRIARLVQLGSRQSRFVGRRMTAFQLLMAATVANLTLLAGAEGPRSVFRCVVVLGRALRRWIWPRAESSAPWRPTRSPSAA